MVFTATLDADVLDQTWVRVLLLEAARYGLYRPTWSQAILDEVRNALATSCPQLHLHQVDRAIERIRLAAPGAAVTGYESLVPSMKNNLKDRHILAVAVHAGAETIVTWNRKHFPSEACDEYDIQVQDPDEFLTTLWDQRPAAMSSVLQHSADSLGCGTVSDFLQQLKRLPRLTSMALGSGSDRGPL